MRIRPKLVPTIEWYMLGFVIKNGHQKDTLKTISWNTNPMAINLCQLGGAHNMTINLILPPTSLMPYTLHSNNKL